MLLGVRLDTHPLCCSASEPVFPSSLSSSQLHLPSDIYLSAFNIKEIDINKIEFILLLSFMVSNNGVNADHY